jgi:hypothetical protein
LFDVGSDTEIRPRDIGCPRVFEHFAGRIGFGGSSRLQDANNSRQVALLADAVPAGSRKPDGIDDVLT